MILRIETTLKSKLLRLVGAAALLFSASGVALADTVGFNPDPKNVALGDMFTVDIVGIGFTELAGGVIDLGFDGAVLQINSVSIDPYWDFLPDGGALTDSNTWSGIGFDVLVNDPAVGDFIIAKISLTALTVGSSSLEILGTSEFFNGSVDELFPTLSNGTVNVVPVPAAVWLFGSGLLGLVGIARRNKAA